MFRRPCSSAAICAGVPSTVLLTPAQADSQSMAALPATPRPAARAAPAARLAPLILSQSAVLFDTLDVRLLPKSPVAVFILARPAR